VNLLLDSLEDDRSRMRALAAQTISAQDDERARIARELHDIVAHAVSVMVLQIGAVRHRLPPGQEEDREALRGVEGAGRDALAEMRRLLGALHDEREGAELAPQPGLDRLDALVEKVRLAGLPVRLQREGDPVPLSPAIDLLSDLVRVSPRLRQRAGMQDPPPPERFWRDRAAVG